MLLKVQGNYNLNLKIQIPEENYYKNESHPKEGQECTVINVLDQTMVTTVNNNFLMTFSLILSKPNKWNLSNSSLKFCNTVLPPNSLPVSVMWESGISSQFKELLACKVPIVPIFMTEYM